MSYAAASDVIIRGGSIFEGSGRPPIVGDLAIQRDSIVAVGPLAALRQLDPFGVMHLPARRKRSVASRALCDASAVLRVAGP